MINNYDIETFPAYELVTNQIRIKLIVEPSLLYLKINFADFWHLQISFNLSFLHYFNCDVQ